MSETVIIFNQQAQKGHMINSLETIQDELSKAGIVADAIVPQSAEHASECTERAVEAGARRIIVAGGDGTINKVVNGLVLAKKKGFGDAAIGIIPNGRGNDFCFSLGVPKKLADDIEIIRRDHRITANVGAAGDGRFERCFINGSGFGIDSAINYHASKTKIGGFPSYVYGLFKAIANDYVQPMVHITLDDYEFDMQLLLFTAMNGMREGGGFVVAPEYDLNDGLLDICAAGDGLGKLQVLPIIPRFFSGKLDHPALRVFKAASVRVEVQDGPGLYSQVDGEDILVGSKVFCSRIIEEKIEIIVPETKQ